MLIFATVIAIIAWGLNIVSYNKEDMNKVLTLEFLSCLLYALSYYLVGSDEAFVGLLVMLIDILKFILYYAFEKDETIFYLTLPLYFLVLYRYFGNVVIFLPLIASIVDGFLSIKTSRAALFGAVVSNFIWLIYDYLIGLKVLAVMDGILVVSSALIIATGVSILLRTRELHITKVGKLTKKIYSRITELSKQYYGVSHAWDEEKTIEILKKNKDNLFLVKDNDRIVGYISYYFITEEKYNNLKRAHNFKELKLNDVCKIKKRTKNNYLYISAINVEMKYQNVILNRMVQVKFKNIINRLYINKYKIKAVVSVPITPFEEEIIDLLGLSKKRVYDDEKNLYENKKTLYYKRI